MINNAQDQIKFYNSISARALLFVTVLSIYVSSLFIYSFGQKEVLLNKIYEIDQLQEAETILMAADLAVFDAITQLLIVLDPLDRNKALAGTHQHFSLLTDHYTKLSEFYPERAPSFFALIGSLAKVVMSPSIEDLRTVKSNLERHKLELNDLIKTNQSKRKQLFTSYKEVSDRAVNNLIMLTLIGLVFITIISSLFFRAMGVDIKRLLIQITGIVARQQDKPLQTKRNDEIGRLIHGINNLSKALDVRDQQLLMERLGKSYYEKVGAIENLTSGLVHELGNPIAAIEGLVAEIERQKESLPQEVNDYISFIRSYNDKLQLINGDLAKIAVQTSSELQLLDVNEVISVAANLLHYDERWYGVNVELVLAPMLPAFYGSDGQLKLLLENLLNNSLEAKSSSSLKICIETMFVADEIVVSIKDNGIGMTDEILNKASTAFFTTKNSSIHSGMGLFSCLTILDSIRGRMSLTSQLNEWTEVRVFIPVNPSVSDSEV
jgi:two-component system, NtrC family, sensor kinase